jgi:hypothetical protein
MSSATRLNVTFNQLEAGPRPAGILGWKIPCQEHGLWHCFCEELDRAGGTQEESSYFEWSDGTVDLLPVSAVALAPVKKKRNRKETQPLPPAFYTVTEIAGLMSWKDARTARRSLTVYAKQFPEHVADICEGFTLRGKRPYRRLALKRDKLNHYLRWHIRQI